MQDESELERAQFDPKLRFYLYWYGVWILLVTVIGVVVLPLWLLFGVVYARRYFNALECVLTDRSLSFHKGVMIRVEKTIPLEQIQDLTLREGPLLRALGLSTLRVETAGQSGGQTGADADLLGIVDARAFRNRVLEERDRLKASPATGEPASPTGGTESLLTEIRDVLVRIENRLDRES